MQADLKQLFAMINELQTLAKRLELPLMNTPTPAPTAVATERARIRDFDPYAAVGAPALQQPIQRVHAYAGVGLDLEEIGDRNYKRQECAFVFDHGRDCWTNETDIHFPPAFSAYTCDTIILDGLDFYKRVVCRMGSPVFLTEGNAVGYLKGKLTIRPDIAADATWRDTTPKPPVHVEPARGVPLSEFLERGKASAKAVDRAQEALSDLYAQAAGIYMPKDPYEPPRVEQVEPEGSVTGAAIEPPAYCDRCERLTVVRRNQLLSIGYQVSHLVELPNEQGYAVPCPSCRTK